MRSTYRSCTAGAATAALTLLGAGLPAVPAGTDGPDLSRFYAQRIEWSRCEGEEMPEDLRCGKVTVPLDYARPGAGTLDVALARYTATAKKKRGSVLLNFGGPGGAGIPPLAHAGEDFMELTKGYDVVSFDPRGVGRSSPVTCGAGTGRFLEATDGADDARDPRTALRQLRRAAADCRENSGPVLPHMGTVSVSRDLDVIRAALGDKKLNYLGFSYGTRLGAVYAARFPDRVGRMALDGVDTLTDTPAEQGLAAARAQQTALEHYLRACTEQVTCPFGQDPRAAREQIVHLIGSLDDDPVPTDYGPDLTGQDLVNAIGQALYSERSWPVLTQALNSLLMDGDTHGLIQLAGGGHAAPYPSRPLRDTHSAALDEAGDRAEKKGNRRDGKGGLVDDTEVPLDNLPAALMAVNCADDPDRPSAEHITRQIGRLRAAYEKASPVFGPSRLTQMLMCHGRPAGTDFIRERVRAVDTPKMLLVGTRGDPATPYRWTVGTAERLGPSAVVLDNRGEGHTGYGSSECVHRKVDDFLLYGSLPGHGSSCGPEE